jgi:hypothetical protein
MVETAGMCYGPHPIRRDQKGWTEPRKAACHWKILPPVCLELPPFCAPLYTFRDLYFEVFGFSSGWTVAQEPRLVNVDGNTLIPDIVAIRDQRAVITDPTIVYEISLTSE